MTASVDRIRTGVLPVGTWTPPSGDGETFHYVDIGSVDREAKAVVGVTELPVGEAPSRARQLLRAEDVLVSTVRPNLNAVAMVPPQHDGAVGSTGFTVLRANPERLLPRFLFHWVRTPMFVADMVKKATGASYPAVSDRIVLDSSMPMPGVDVQRRIADMLDKADAIRRKWKEAIALTDELLRSTFLEMFGDPVANPKGWPTGAVGDYALRVTKGESPGWQGFAYQDEGVRFVTSENVLWGSVDLQKAKFVPPDFDEKIQRSRLRVDDVLVNLVGASVGRTALVPPAALPANINQAVAVVTLRREELAPEFLLHQLLTSAMQHRLLGNVVDAARANISLTNIRELEVVVPPVHEQERWRLIASEVAGLKSRQESAVDDADRLFASLVHQSFLGVRGHATMDAGPR